MKPLLITDCDEVLLHMVRHFGEWLGDTHAIDFALEGGDFADSMRRRSDGSRLVAEEMWAMLDGFFPAEMERQTLVPHAREVLSRLAEVADIVVLTNLGDHCRDHRITQLGPARHRPPGRMQPGGARAARSHAWWRNMAHRWRCSSTILATHHESVARHAPDVFRLHMIAEPSLAAVVPPAPHAHARIDDWSAAEPWILERFAQA